jgi:hypothetical protein
LSIGFGIERSGRVMAMISHHATDLGAGHDLRQSTALR